MSAPVGTVQIQPYSDYCLNTFLTAHIQKKEWDKVIDLIFQEPRNIEQLSDEEFKSVVTNMNVSQHVNANKVYALLVNAPQMKSLKYFDIEFLAIVVSPSRTTCNLDDILTRLNSLISTPYAEVLSTGSLKKICKAFQQHGKDTARLEQLLLNRNEELEQKDPEKASGWFNCFKV